MALHDYTRCLLLGLVLEEREVGGEADWNSIRVVADVRQICAVTEARAEDNHVGCGIWLWANVGPSPGADASACHHLIDAFFVPRADIHALIVSLVGSLRSNPLNEQMQEVRVHEAALARINTVGRSVDVAISVVLLTSRNLPSYGLALSEP